MLGRYRPASEMPFKWRFAGGPIDDSLLLVVLDPFPLITKKNKNKKKKRRLSGTPDKILWTSAGLKYISYLVLY